MEITRSILVLAAVVGLVETATAARPTAIHVAVDAGSGQITRCGTADTETQAAGVKGCLVTAHEGAVIAVSVEHALPGLFTYTTESHERAVSLVSADLAGALGLSAPEPEEETAQAADTFRTAAPAGATPDPLILYGEVIAAFQELTATVNGSYTSGDYEKARRMLVDARAEFLKALAMPDESSAVAAAIAERATPQPLPADAGEQARLVARREALASDVKASWDAVREMLKTSPVKPASLGPFLVTFREGEVDIALKIVPTSANPTGVAREVAIPVREKHGWGWSTSTGFAAAGLTDQNFSARTVTVTPATDTKEAVTRRELVAESSDRLRVQPSIFLHLYPFGGAWERVALTTGASLSPSTNAQVYAGASVRLGRIGTFTAGIAGGNVKRQSLNVDPRDLGDLDPQQTRRDVFMTRLFVAITARFAGAR
jgi:hypothetical protein